MDSLSLIAETLQPLAGKAVLDVGCGGGALARSLSRMGAAVTGIDPAAETIGTARRNAPEARFETAGAEALPFADDTFDAALFLNSLHHVPGALMVAALREARRVVRPAGPLIVIEPLAHGTFFEAVRTIEDETEVRAEAQAAIAEALRLGIAGLIRKVEYVRRERFTGLDEFLTRVTAVDSRRNEVVARERPTIERAFQAHAEQDGTGGYLLDQPLRAHILGAGG